MYRDLNAGRNWGGFFCAFPGCFGRIVAGEGGFQVVLRLNRFFELSLTEFVSGAFVYFVV